MKHFILPKRIFLIILFTSLFLYLPVQAQTIKIGLTGGIDFPIKVQSQNNSNGPSWVQENNEEPSLASYFNGDLLGGIYSVFEFPLESGTKIKITGGYEHGARTNSSSGTGNILGESLSLQTYSFGAGAGFYVNDDRTVALSFSLGLALKYYEGTSTLNNLNLVHHYGDEKALRIGGNIEFEQLMQSRLSLALEAICDIGSVDRKEVDFFQGNTKVAIGTPTGDINLADASLSFRITLFYALRQSLSDEN